MIKDIEIENFRGFEKIKISGFERVNLISGQNNAGKTALLEALLLNSSPRPASVFFLRQTRGESAKFSQAVPERTWDYWFFNQNKDEKINITVKDKNQIKNILEISVDESVQNFIEDNKDNESIEEQMIRLSNSESVVSVLNLNIKSVDGINEKSHFRSSIMASSKGIIGKDVKIPDLKDAFLFPASFKLPNRVLAEQYDKYAGFDIDSREEILNLFQLFDNSVEEVKTISIGEPSVYLKRIGEKHLPLSLFGDAINRVAQIVLVLVNNQNSILLIDEIENGIHYTKQEELWKILFRLANKVDNQIFATTHSKEMLEAFAKVGVEKEYEGIGAHFELARHAKTKQTIGIKRDLETLDYAIEHEQGVRGE